MFLQLDLDSKFCLYDSIVYRLLPILRAISLLLSPLQINIRTSVSLGVKLNFIPLSKAIFLTSGIPLSRITHKRLYIREGNTPVNI